MDGNIFISYRRGPDSNAAGRLYDRLERNFPPESLFFDIDSIPMGVDFAQHIQGEVEKCDVQLVVIGPGWLEATDRLQNPDDFVRLEIEAALTRDTIPVVPLLFDGAQMPTRDDLPESLHPLVRRNAIMVSHAQFAQIVDGRLTTQLREAIAQAVEAQKAAEAALAEAEAERARQLAEKVREEQLKLQQLEGEKRKASDEPKDRDQKASDSFLDVTQTLKEQRAHVDGQINKLPQVTRHTKSAKNETDGLVNHDKGKSYNIYPANKHASFSLPKRTWQFAAVVTVFLITLVYFFQPLSLLRTYQHNQLLGERQFTAGGYQFTRLGTGLCESKFAPATSYAKVEVNYLQNCADRCSDSFYCTGFNFVPLAKIGSTECTLYNSTITSLFSTSQRQDYCYRRDKTND